MTLLAPTPAPVGGVPVARRPRRVGRLFAILMLAAWFLVPVIVLAASLFAEVWRAPDVFPQRLGLDGWREAFGSGNDLGDAAWHGALVAGLAAVVSLVLAVLAARALVLRRWRGRPIVAALLALPLLVPPIAIVGGLQLVMIRLGLDGTIGGVSFALVAVTLPYATGVMAAAYLGYPVERTRQLRTLGAGPYRAWRLGELPALLPSIALAGALSFSVAWSDYLFTRLVGAGAFETVPTRLIPAAAGVGNDQLVAVLSLALLTPPLLIFLAAGFIGHRNRFGGST